MTEHQSVQFSRPATFTMRRLTDTIHSCCILSVLMWRRLTVCWKSRAEFPAAVTKPDNTDSHLHKPEHTHHLDLKNKTTHYAFLHTWKTHLLQILSGPSDRIYLLPDLPLLLIGQNVIERPSVWTTVARPGDLNTFTSLLNMYHHHEWFHKCKIKQTRYRNIPLKQWNHHTTGYTTGKRQNKIRNV